MSIVELLAARQNFLNVNLAVLQPPLEIHHGNRRDDGRSERGDKQVLSYANNVFAQHRAPEKTPRDQTVRDQFDAYRFADYKDRVIELVGRVTRVSVETQGIIAEMMLASKAR